MENDALEPWTKYRFENGTIPMIMDCFEKYGKNIDVNFPFGLH
jgi:hypothetical protein